MYKSALIILFTLKFFIFKFITIKSHESDIGRNINPIISEMFDMLIESIEKNREIKSNNKLKENKYIIGKDINLINNNKEDKFNEDLDIIKIIDRDITFNDNVLNLKLNLIVSSKFKQNSILVFKKWSDEFLKYNFNNENYNELCSSSNINNDIIIEPIYFKEFINYKENNLIFNLNYNLTQVIDKTFLLCLSDSITSNHSIYITKLSFSKINLDNEKININTNNYTRQYFYQDLHDKEYNKLYIKINIPKDKICSEYELIIVNKQNDIIKKGELDYSIKNKYNDLCFWTLELIKDYFEANTELNIINIYKKENSKDIIGTISYMDHNYDYNLFLNSIILKILFFIFKIIPITLIIYCLIIIIMEFSNFISNKLLEFFKEYKIYFPHLQFKSEFSYNTNIELPCYDNSKRNIEEKRVLNWYKSNKEKVLNNSSYNIINSPSLNLSESNNSSNESNEITKDDPLKYFDSDCSISTYTGI